MIGVRFEETRKQLLVDGHLAIILLPRDLALRTWVAQFPSSTVPGSKQDEPLAVPLIADTYLLAGSGSQGKRMWADLEFLPGEHELAVLLPHKPSACRVDGAPADISYDEGRPMASLRLTTPALPYHPVAISQGESWVERFNPESGPWKPSTLKPLEDEGPDPYGYVKYVSGFTYGDRQKMFIDAYTDDGKKVFLNGRYVAEASNKARQVEFELAKYAKLGINTLQIAYESFGALNGHKEMGDLKGIRSVSVGSGPQSSTLVGSWQIERFPAPMQGRKLNPDFEPPSLKKASFKASGLSAELIPAFTWCRSEFVLPAVAAAWAVPWKLAFGAERDALIFLNGKFVGRYVTVGPQTEFYLPDAYLEAAGKRNRLTFVLAYTDRPQHVRRLEVGPYREFSARRTRVEFEL
ncbi:MAG: beta galactosidase jelly roll domain-containing protein [Acidobacteriota bacterium]